MQPVDDNQDGNNFKSLLLTTVLLSTAVVSGCTSLLKDHPKIFSVTIKDTQETRLGQDIARFRLNNNELSGFYLLPDGIDAFVARMLLIGVAERSLNVQYYIWHNDTIGKLFANALI